MYCGLHIKILLTKVTWMKSTDAAEQKLGNRANV